jgi:hypothetical protein
MTRTSMSLYEFFECVRHVYPPPPGYFVHTLREGDNCVVYHRPLENIGRFYRVAVFPYPDEILATYNRPTQPALW